MVQQASSHRWYTLADQQKYSEQATKILRLLIREGSQGRAVDVGTLEKASGATRVASRIDELRDKWDIKTYHGLDAEGDGRARYWLTGPQPEGYVRPKRVLINLEVLKTLVTLADPPFTSKERTALDIANEIIEKKEEAK